MVSDFGGCLGGDQLPHRPPPLGGWGVSYLSGYRAATPTRAGGRQGNQWRPFLVQPGGHDLPAQRARQIRHLSGDGGLPEPVRRQAGPFSHRHLRLPHLAVTGHHHFGAARHGVDAGLLRLSAGDVPGGAQPHRFRTGGLHGHYGRAGYSVSLSGFTGWPTHGLSVVIRLFPATSRVAVRTRGRGRRCNHIRGAGVRLQLAGDHRAGGVLTRCWSLPSAPAQRAAGGRRDLFPALGSCADFFH